MGKHRKTQRHDHRRGRRTSHLFREEDDEEIHDCPQSPPNSTLQQVNLSDSDRESQERDTNTDNNPSNNDELPSKYLLYQQSVQSPKGDISYLQKFFLMYVGGRVPLHLQEDFCGTALLSVEWTRGDARRSAVGLDLDVEALNWCMENNAKRIGTDICSRLLLFHGNVLQPLDSKLINFKHDVIMQNTRLKGKGSDSLICTENSQSLGRSEATQSMKETQLPARDIVCAFNYSCCCLQNRNELILYFKHALNALSTKGGIFVMDLYGGTSSENELRMKRRFSDFTYVWEQAEFNIIQRKTRISLHFHLHKQHKRLQHAFSYSWRLWSLPEVKDCLEEAGFRAIHFWICSMPDSEQVTCMDGFSIERDIKYEEATRFNQQDSWNAYVVGVA